MNKVRREVIQRLVSQDALGLRTRSESSIVDGKGLRHLPDVDKIDNVRDWVSSLLKESVDTMYRDTAQYTDDAYTKGLTRAFDDVRKPVKSVLGDDDVATALGTRVEYYKGRRDEFIKEASQRRDIQSRRDVLHQRIRNEFQSMADSLSSAITRAATDAIAQGKSTKELREVLTDVFKKATARVRRISSNELIRVFAESQLDGFEILGVERVGVAVEWGTAGDEKVCGACSSLGRMVLTIREARGMIPRHVGCRCAWVPFGVGKDKGKPKRTQSKVRAAIRKSKKTGIGSSSWARGKRISKKRPPIVSKIEQAQATNTYVHVQSCACVECVGRRALYSILSQE